MEMEEDEILKKILTKDLCSILKSLKKGKKPKQDLTREVWALSIMLDIKYGSREMRKMMRHFIEYLKSLPPRDEITEAVDTLEHALGFKRNGHCGYYRKVKFIKAEK